MHPAYGAGHATVAGACVTILKAWFDEKFILPSPVVASKDGQRLEPWNGAHQQLTVGNELNKLAANIAIGRNAGGVHYWADYTASMQLGECVAVSILQDLKTTLNESIEFKFTNFAGEKVVV